MSTELETLRGELHAISSIDNRNDDDRAEKLADVFAGKYVDGCVASESEIIAVRKTLAYCKEKFIEPLQLHITNETAQRKQLEAERDALQENLAAIEQSAGELCTLCGWAMKFPDAPCRCELEIERDKLRSRVAKLEESAAFVYNAVLASSVCSTKCECIDCDILETLGEQLGIPTIGET